VLSGLLAEKERILSALQELDFDNSLGKIPLEQYPLQRNVLVQKGAEILSSLDKLGYKPGPSKGSLAKTNNHEKPAYDDLEEMISRRRIEKNGKNKGFCSKCGNAIHEADKFCPKCGTTV
jgi:hypothetical protein